MTQHVTTADRLRTLTKTELTVDLPDWPHLGSRGTVNRD